MILSASNSIAKSDQIFEIQKVGEWLTSNEAARFLGITPNALRIKVCRGSVKFWKLNGRLRFRTDELVCLLQKGA